MTHRVIAVSLATRQQSGALSSTTLPGAGLVRGSQREGISLPPAAL